MDMKYIALLTDFGLDDHFVGVMKAVILNINPSVSIIDISHNIRPQDVFEGAFLLRNSYRYFSKDTVFVVVVDPGVGSRRKPIIIRTADYTFVGPDNGVLSLAVEEGSTRTALEIKNDKYFLKPVSNIFHGRDIFASVAAHISKGERLENFGPKTEIFSKLNIPIPEIAGNSLKGKVVYIDRFGNLITNIEREALVRFINNKKFEIKMGDTVIGDLSESYADATPASPLAIIGSFDCLEISVNRGSAKDYFNAEEGRKVEVVLK